MHLRDFTANYWSPAPAGDIVERELKSASLKVRVLAAKLVLRASIFEGREDDDAFYLAEDGNIYHPLKRSDAQSARESFMSEVHLKTGLVRRNNIWDHPFSRLGLSGISELFNEQWRPSSDPAALLAEVQEYLDANCALIDGYFVSRATLPVYCVSVDNQTYKEPRVLLTVTTRSHAASSQRTYAHPVAFFSADQLARAEILATDFANLLEVDGFHRQGKLNQVSNFPSESVHGLIVQRFETIAKGIAFHAFQVPSAVVRCIPDLLSGPDTRGLGAGNRHLWDKVLNAAPNLLHVDRSTPKEFARLALSLLAQQASIYGVSLRTISNEAESPSAPAVFHDLLEVARPYLIPGGPHFVKAWVDILDLAREGRSSIHTEIELLERCMPDIKPNSRVEWRNAVRAAKAEALRAEVLEGCDPSQQGEVDVVALFTEIEPLLETLRSKSLSAASAGPLHEHIGAVLDRIRVAKFQASPSLSAETKSPTFEP